MRLLTVSSLYPNSAQPQRGVFVRERLRRLVADPDIHATVIAPVPWFPISAEVFGTRAVFARVPRVEHGSEGTVYHPRYFHLPKIGDAVSPVFFAGAVLREIRRRHLVVDLIDAHFLFPDGVAAVLVARRLRCPVSLTARGSDVNLFPDEAIARRWIQWGIRRADALIAVSTDLGARLSALAGGRAVSVVRNGVDTCLFKPAPNREALRTELGFTGFTLLSVGNLIELKGHHLVIDALRMIADASLVIVGQGPLERELIERAQRLGLSSRVRMLRPIPQDRLKDYYAAADALVLASSHEGMPNVVLEGLAVGTPVVATATGGAREVLDGTAAGVFCTRNAQGIADAVGSLRARTPSRDEVRGVAMPFDWRHSTEQVRGILERIARRRPVDEVVR